MKILGFGNNARLNILNYFDHRIYNPLKVCLSSKIVKKYDIHWLDFMNDTVNYADIQIQQKN